ncbi:unnamed protein product [Caenorhabditis auriculariae]|uniref:Uncharacterized protein n=1 Tax=Caenorhabditis auriculariae TaxID=2777116 RepID=A0A8S1HIR6_9PELO|nr:unnamed protein product [Caenorhabditis auriculariae]
MGDQYMPIDGAGAGAALPPPGNGAPLPPPPSMPSASGVSLDDKYSQEHNYFDDTNDAAVHSASSKYYGLVAPVSGERVMTVRGRNFKEAQKKDMIHCLIATVVVSIIPAIFGVCFALSVMGLEHNNILGGIPPLAAFFSSDWINGLRASDFKMERHFGNNENDHLGAEEPVIQTDRRLRIWLANETRSPSPMRRRRSARPLERIFLGPPTAAEASITEQNRTRGLIAQEIVQLASMAFAPTGQISDSPPENEEYFQLSPQSEESSEEESEEDVLSSENHSVYDDEPPQEAPAQNYVRGLLQPSFSGFTNQQQHQHPLHVANVPQHQRSFIPIDIPPQPVLSSHPRYPFAPTQYMQQPPMHHPQQPFLQTGANNEEFGHSLLSQSGQGTSQHYGHPMPNPQSQLSQSAAQQFPSMAQQQWQSGQGTSQHYGHPMPNPQSQLSQSAAQQFPSMAQQQWHSGQGTSQHYGHPMPNPQSQLSQSAAQQFPSMAQQQWHSGQGTSQHYGHPMPNPQSQLSQSAAQQFPSMAQQQWHSGQGTSQHYGHPMPNPQSQLSQSAAQQFPSMAQQQWHSGQGTSQHYGHPMPNLQSQQSQSASQHQGRPIPNPQSQQSQSASQHQGRPLPNSQSQQSQSTAQQFPSMAQQQWHSGRGTSQHYGHPMPNLQSQQSQSASQHQGRPIPNPQSQQSQSASQHQGRPLPNSQSQQSQSTAQQFSPTTQPQLQSGQTPSRQIRPMQTQHVLDDAPGPSRPGPSNVFPRGSPTRRNSLKLEAEFVESSATTEQLSMANKSVEVVSGLAAEKEADRNLSVSTAAEQAEEVPGPRRSPRIRRNEAVELPPNRKQRETDSEESSGESVPETSSRTKTLPVTVEQEEVAVQSSSVRFEETTESRDSQQASQVPVASDRTPRNASIDEDVIIDESAHLLSGGPASTSSSLDDMHSRMQPQPGFEAQDVPGPSSQRRELQRFEHETADPARIPSPALEQAQSSPDSINEAPATPPHNSQAPSQPTSQEDFEQRRELVFNMRMSTPILPDQQRHYFEMSADPEGEWQNNNNPELIFVSVSQAVEDAHEPVIQAERELQPGNAAASAEQPEEEPGPSRSPRKRRNEAVELPPNKKHRETEPEGSSGDPVPGAISASRLEALPVTVEQEEVAVQSSSVRLEEAIGDFQLACQVSMALLQGLPGPSTADDRVREADAVSEKDTYQNLIKEESTDSSDPATAVEPPSNPEQEVQLNRRDEVVSDVGNEQESHDVRRVVVANPDNDPNLNVEDTQEGSDISASAAAVEHSEEGHPKIVVTGPGSSAGNTPMEDQPGPSGLGEARDAGGDTEGREEGPARRLRPRPPTSPTVGRGSRTRKLYNPKGERPKRSTAKKSLN